MKVKVNFMKKWKWGDKNSRKYKSDVKRILWFDWIWIQKILSSAMLNIKVKIRKIPKFYPLKVKVIKKVKVMWKEFLRQTGPLGYGSEQSPATAEGRKHTLIIRKKKSNINII